jgi:hypothetical protein
MRKHFTALAPPSSPARSLNALVRHVIERMDPTVLRNTVSVGKDNLLLERCWQMEVYRALKTVLPANVVPSPDVGQVRVTCTTVNIYADS